MALMKWSVVSYVEWLDQWPWVKIHISMYVSLYNTVRITPFESETTMDETYCFMMKNWHICIVFGQKMSFYGSTATLQGFLIFLEN